MDKKDLGAVDEARAAEGTPEGDPDSDRQSRPVPKADPPKSGPSVQLSQTFQSEVHKHQGVPPELDDGSVQLSQTFQSEVAKLKPKAKIPPPKLSPRPLPPAKKTLTPEVAKAEKLAKRLPKQRKSGQRIPAAKPPAKPIPPPPKKKRVPSRNATLEGVPFSTVPTPHEARPSPLQQAPERATIEGPAPTMEQIEAAARAEGLTPPSAEETPNAEGTAPTIDSPPGIALDPTPTGTSSTPRRTSPPTLTGDGRRNTSPSGGMPAFASELIDSDATKTPPSSDNVDLSATFRSEVLAFDDAQEEDDEPELVVQRRAPTDNESSNVPLDEDDPFGDLSTGTELGGRYRLERVIGRGATGVVFEASHLIIGKRVALKCLYPHYLDTPNAVERFFREARIAATVEHPNVVQVFDGGDSGDTMFLAMELLVGETLGDRLERGPLAVAEALDMFLKIADGVAAVHERGVVHRDLKPDNVFLPEPKGGRPIEPKVLDFGVSKLKEPGRKELTSLGTVLGTPYYMAPEQIRNTRDVDATADVYSLGVILYEMLAGELPYDGDSVVDIFESARDGVRTPLEEHCPNLPAGLSSIVDKAMSAEREDRFAGARDFYTAVSAVSVAGTDPDRDPPTDPAKAGPAKVFTPPQDPKTTLEEAIPSPLVAKKADSVPERDIQAIAAKSDALFDRDKPTVELDRDSVAIPPAPEPTETTALTKPPKRSRAWMWVLAAVLTLVVSGVIGAAVLELMRRQ